MERQGNAARRASGRAVAIVVLSGAHRRKRRRIDGLLELPQRAAWPRDDERLAIRRDRQSGECRRHRWRGMPRWRERRRRRAERRARQHLRGDLGRRRRWFRVSGTSRPRALDLPRGRAAHPVDGRGAVGPAAAGCADHRRRVVLRAGDSSAFFASGSSTPSPPPDFIPKYHDVSIVRGGTAYAVVPRFGWARDHAIELYASDGTHCATLDFPERTGLYIGADGTVIATDPHDLCKASWWPHLLR